MIEEASFLLREPQETAKFAASLASSLYRRGTVILLQGELGAGKTTFAQGFAQGIGISSLLPSPTFTLCNEYPGLRHIDLYRLKESEAQAFLQTLDRRDVITLIEWPERAKELPAGPRISIQLESPKKQETFSRRAHVSFLDVEIPEEVQIERWREEVKIAAHIRLHTDIVARVAEQLANDLLERRIIVRKQALIAAAKLHDLLRFVDFKSFEDDRFAIATKEQVKTWSQLQQQYGKPHELAAERFLAERGYSELGHIIATHGAHRGTPTPAPLTIEQKLLAYSDKRVIFDRIVTLKERFEDIEDRYGTAESKSEGFYLRWHQAMKGIEQELFPSGTPVLL